MILIISKITSEYFTVIRNIDTREKEMKTSYFSKLPFSNTKRRVEQVSKISAEKNL